jgi:hypothetical protein
VHESCAPVKEEDCPPEEVHVADGLTRASSRRSLARAAGKKAPANARLKLQKVAPLDAHAAISPPSDDLDSFYENVHELPSILRR